MNKKILPLFAFILGGYITNAQVGIGTATPNSSSQLDIVSSDKGILIPQVSLKSSKDTSTITNGNVNSLLVFNTATISDITPGYYYWFSGSWLRLGHSSDTPLSSGNLIWDPINNVFSYVDEKGISQVINISKLIQNKEKETTLTNNGKGEYTYLNEKDKEVTISVIGDVKANIADLLANQAVKDAVSAVAAKTDGVVTYDAVKKILDYTDKDGKAQQVDLKTIVLNNETETTLVKSTDPAKLGDYIYTNEKKEPVTISVIGDVKANIADLLADPSVKAAVSAVAAKTDGVVTYDAVKKILDYTDKDGKAQQVDLKTIVLNNETETTLVKSTDPAKLGDYIYTNEKKEPVTISVIGDVKANIADLLADPSVKAAVSAVAAKTDGVVTYDAVKKILDYTDKDGKAQQVDLKTIVLNNETETTLVKSTDPAKLGDYIYTNEKKEPVTISVIGDVKANIADLLADPSVKAAVSAVAAKTDGVVTYDAVKKILDYTDKDGKAQQVDLKTIVLNNETETTLVKSTDPAKLGDYIYTNEKKEPVTISVIGDVKANIADLLADPSVKAAVSAVAAKTDGVVTYDAVKKILDYTDKDGKAQQVDLKTIVLNNETETTLVKSTDPAKLGDYIYTNEKKEPVTISVIGDVKANIADLLADPSVKAAVSAVAAKTDGVVTYDAVKKILDYTDKDGKAQQVDLKTIVLNNETETTLVKSTDPAKLGDYIYTNEKKEPVTISVIGDVKANIADLLADPSVKAAVSAVAAKTDGVVTYDAVKKILDYTDKDGKAQQVDLKTIVLNNETETTLVKSTDPAKLGDYIYTNEKKEPVTISVIGDVKANIADLLADPSVKAAVSAVAAKTDGVVTYDAVKKILDYTDKDGKAQQVDLKTIVLNNETETTLVKSTDPAKLGDYIYTNEKKEPVTISVIGDVKANIADLLADPSVKAAVSAVAAKTDGVVTYDAVKKILDYTDKDGKAQQVDLKTIVLNNETETTLVKSTDPAKLGDYIYTNEKKEPVTISVIGDVKANIADLLADPSVKAAVSAVAAKTDGVVTYDAVKKILDYTDKDGKAQQVDLKTIVLNNETETTLVKSTDPAKLGDYIYTNEKKEPVTISVIGDVKANIADLLADPSVKAAVSAVAAKTDGVVTYDAVKKILDYTDKDGKAQQVDLKTIVLNNETETTLVKSTDPAKLGDYIYTNEKKEPVTISVIGDVKANIADLLADPSVKAAVSAVAAKTDGVVTYDAVKKILDYTDKDGKAQQVDLKTIVLNNETETTLVKSTDPAKLGDYIYTNEKKEPVTISVIGDVKANIADLLADPSVKAAVSAVAAKTDGVVTYDAVKKILDYTDKDGKAQQVDLKTIVLNNETETTLVKSTDPAKLGDYIYTNEKKEPVTISVIGDVKANIADLLADPSVKAAVSAVAAKTDGVVTYDAVKKILDYTDKDGKAQQVDLKTIVLNNETETTLVKSTDPAKLGDYIYTNEKKEPVTISVIGDVKANIADLLADPSVKAAVSAVAAKTDGVVTYDAVKKILDYTDKDGKAQQVDLKTIVLNNETETTLVKSTDPAKLGDYIYTNEKKEPVTISVIGDVKANIADLLADPSVKAAVSAVAAKTDGVVTYDAVKKILDYTDKDGKAQQVDLKTIVLNNETETTLVKSTDPAKLGDYIYTNEKKEPVTISVIGDVKANIADLLADPSVKAAVSAVAAKTDGVVTYDAVKKILDYTDKDGKAQQVDLKTIVLNNETETTLVKSTDPAKLGDYIYTNEKKEPVTISVIGDVKANIADLLADPSVKAAVSAVAAKTDGVVTYDAVKKILDYTDKDGKAQQVDLKTIVLNNETETTLVKSTDPAKLGDYIYTNEKKEPVTISVIGDVKANIADLLADPSVKAAVSAVAAKTDGVVTYDAVKKILDYTDKDGKAQQVDLKTIVLNNETETTLVKSTDPAKLGDYIYTNEKKEPVTISVIGDVKANIADLLADPSVKAAVSAVAAKTDGVVTYDAVKKILDYTDKDGKAQQVDLKTIVLNNETETTLVKSTDPAKLGDYIYTNEKKEPVTISVIGDVKANIADLLADKAVKDAVSAVAAKTAGVVTYDAVNKVLDYTDKDGIAQKVDLKAIAKANETPTTLTPDPVIKGNYVYKNEQDLPFTISVIGDVKANIADILADKAVKDAVSAVVAKTAGVVTYDAVNKVLDYTDKDGIAQKVDLDAIVKAGSSHTLESVGNDITSVVNGISQRANAVNKVDLTLNGNILESSVNDVKKTLDVTSLKVEPWNVFGGTSQATSNGDQIYTKGTWVGIGTDKKSNTGDEALFVNGKIKANTSVYADYVFEDYFQGYSDLKADYEFKSLDAVEKFIIENKHLPGVTPIGKLEKTDNGYSIDPTELGVQNLEKIEELYLHTIEQQKQINLKEEQINRLKKDAEEMKARLERLEAALLSNK